MELDLSIWAWGNVPDPTQPNLCVLLVVDLRLARPKVCLAYGKFARSCQIHAVSFCQRWLTTLSRALGRFFVRFAPAFARLEGNDTFPIVEEIFFERHDQRPRNP